ncbi:MAG: hypothetical protein IKE18_03730 [Oscillospiraceae bacterium]|nr:hypothetical protein [Oscillospiraceae bacterium]
MTREKTVRNLLTELIDMIDNGSQRDLDRADEIGASIIKLFKQKPVLEQIRAEIYENINYNKRMNYQGIVAGLLLTLDIIDKYRGNKE